MDYYNDTETGFWLRALMEKSLIPPGYIDERDIKNVKRDELDGYKQCHFFAGIGGWSRALQLGGWSEDWPIWTGSCPCQPFSLAGKRKGNRDKRHLWPAWCALIEECRPPTIFGEQVASPLGREWLSGVQTDLEVLGYTFGAADLCAACVNSPHHRQRLWWVAYAQDSNWWRKAGENDAGWWFKEAGRSSAFGGAPDLRGNGWKQTSHEVSWLGNAFIEGSQRQSPMRGCKNQWSPWETSLALPFKDGKWRRTEPGTFPLAHGVPKRVAKLRGLGNAIVPQVATIFIRAFIESITI